MRHFSPNHATDFFHRFHRVMRHFSPNRFRAVTFTPDGRYMATANANGAVYLLRSGAPRASKRHSRISNINS
jgi:hypothetical protein